MSAQELLRTGQLKEAVAAILTEVRDNPADHRRRTFLFELLCFAGEFERAGKHLGVLADETPDAGVGALLYRSAVSA
jgi:type VI secretion system protein ImpE